MTSFAAHTQIEFITVTRGGGDGLIAVISINEDHKYYEIDGLRSLLKTYTVPPQQAALQQAIKAVSSVNDLDDVPEFEGGLPVQGSLF